jgi:hypothetical protein
MNGMYREGWHEGSFWKKKVEHRRAEERQLKGRKVEEGKAR